MRACVLFTDIWFTTEFMRLHQERKLASSKLLRHEAGLEKLRSILDDTMSAVEIYVMLRDDYDRKLKQYFKRKLSEKDDVIASIAAGSEAPSRGMGARKLSLSRQKSRGEEFESRRNYELSEMRSEDSTGRRAQGQHTTSFSHTMYN